MALENCNPEIIHLLLERKDLNFNSKIISFNYIYYDNTSFISDHIKFENGRLHINVENCDFDLVENTLNRPDIKKVIFNLIHRFHFFMFLGNANSIKRTKKIKNRNKSKEEVKI